MIRSPAPVRGPMRISCAMMALVLGLPVSAAAQGGFASVPHERVERTAEHYPETNERRHDVWFGAIDGLGGAYLGVGSDPNYTLAAAAGAELVALVDYDPVVTRLHRAMIALIARCPDAACLRRSLEPDREARSADLVAAALEDGWEAERTVRAFRVHRPLLAARMAELAEQDGFVSRPGWYAHLHRLAARGRIVARTADLRGPRTIRAIAREALRRGLTFRVLYLSNAEEYFRYEDGFTGNLNALPTDERALVLRTFRDRRLPRPEGESAWHYNVQPVSDLLSRIERRGYEDSSWLLRDLLAARPDASGLSRIDGQVPALAEPGPRRWWLSDTDAPPSVDRRDGVESRLLLVYRRAIGRSLAAAQRRRLRAVDLRDTGVARVGRVALPHSPWTSRAFVLSGEPDARSVPTVDEPERALQAMMLDRLGREVLPRLLDRAELEEEAGRLRSAPAANDLYAAYRLRERLREICPADRRPRGREGRALRACRHLARMVRPVPTTRARPGWSERRGRIARALRGFASEVRALDGEEGGRRMVALLERLATLARRTRAIAQRAR